jgi:lipopolysaccharide cholinephosphotransferase
MEDLSHYNPEGSNLRKAQMRMLEILTAFDEICNRNNIPYFLDGGTLLGARRHGGFIPWDDDIDVKILQKDYNRLIKALEKELPPQYKVQTRKTDKNYFFDFAKVRDTKTYYREDQNESHDFKYTGAYIDIFTIEPLFSVYIKRKMDRIRNRFMFRAGSKNIFGWIFNTSIMGLLYPLYFVRKYVVRFLRKFIKTDTYYHSPGSIVTQCHKLNEIFPLKKISFEGKMFNAPKDVDAVLTRFYGKDFMTLPPPEKRAIHASEIIFYD